MKKILFPLVLLVVLLVGNIEKVNAQPPFIIFEEYFEDPNPLNWAVSRSSFPLNRPNAPYAERLVTSENSLGASADTTGPDTRSFLETPDFKINLYTSYNLSFNQICYVEGLEDARVEYSFDGGATWDSIPSAPYIGSSTYFFNFANEHKFSKISRPTLWQAGRNDFIWGPKSKAWIREDFSLDGLINARPAGTDSMRIRLGLYDDPSSQLGRAGTHIWYVDNLVVIGGDCDLIPPAMVLKDPPDNYPARYEGRVYLNGPWLFDATVTDNRGQIDTTYIVYEVTRLDPLSGVYTSRVIDTIGMDRFAGSNFKGKIDILVANSNGFSISPGDSVFWKVESRDGSACGNLTQDPRSGRSAFEVRPDLPKSCKTQPIYQFPYYEDFDSLIYQTTNKNVIGLPDADWENVTGDFHQWWTQAGPSSDTGQFRILGDYPGGGKYLYVESDRIQGGSYKDSSAFLLSPCFDFTDLANGKVHFYLNMNTAGIEDSINVDIFDPTPTPLFPNGRFKKNVIPVVKGNKGANWLPFEFSTFPYKNFITQIRFAGNPGRDDGLGDMALDSFKVIPSALIDLRLNEVLLGPFIPSGNDLGGGIFQDVVEINVQNLGIADVSTFTMDFEIIQKGNVVFSGNQETWAGTPLIPGENRNIKFNALSNSYPVPLGKYSIKAWLSYVNDAVVSNDTSFANSRGLAYMNGKKYMDDFDGDTLWNVFLEDDSLNNQWELGTPNYDFTNSAYTIPNSWDILLNRSYTGTGKTVRLLSPFMNFSQVDDGIMSFINNRDINIFKDGMFVEYSLDRGLTWDSVVSTLDPGKLKWYNSTLSAGGFGGNPVFAGITYCVGNTWRGFLESELQLPPIFNFKPEVLFRFSFFAETGGFGNDGISIDNFLIYDPEPLDLQVQHFLSPNSMCALTTNEKIKTVIKNRGLTTVNSFTMEYTLTHTASGAPPIVKTEVINRTIAHRDTIHVTSVPTFDMFAYGDFDIQVKAILPGDQCFENDAITTLVENVEGCSLQFYIETSGKPNQQLPCDSSVWKFDYTSGGRSYQVSGAFNNNDPRYRIGFSPSKDTIRDLFVCMKSDAKVKFNLDDKDSLIDSYSFIAYNGKEDIILYREVLGGPDSPIQRFDWICPPQRSASPIAIHLDGDKVQLPLNKDYFIDVDILNNGLDSLDSLDLYFKVDNLTPVFRKVRYDPVLKYREFKKFPVGFFPLASGVHQLCAWTDKPNNQGDLLPSDDTLCITFTVIDTLAFNSRGIAGGNNIISDTLLCNDFDDQNEISWVSANPYSLNQLNPLFEKGTPTSPVINAAFSGADVWATKLDTSYGNLAEGMIMSPFFYIKADSCYKVSFMHNYFITDSLHDGGTVRYLTEDYTNLNADYSDKIWQPLGALVLDDTTRFSNPPVIRKDTVIVIGDTIFADQKNWYNTRHILSIPDNSKNMGWTGDSRGWKLAESILRPTSTYYSALMWRFESDGSKVSDGWAIDDFCITKLPETRCYPLAIPEINFNKASIYLGQNIPNPAAYSTVIPYYLPASGNVTFEVINLLGQPVFSESFTKPRGDGILEVDLSNMSKGVYYYTMTFQGKRVTNKMVVAQ